MTAIRSLRGFVSGRVQGVGFRYFVQRLARTEGLGGYVRNLPDGRVEFRLQGQTDGVDRVLRQIRRGPETARVDDMSLDESDSVEVAAEFVILR